MSLDRIEQTINDAQARLEAQAGDQARALAVAMARGQKAPTNDLSQAIAATLSGLFVTGRHTVVEELQRQRLGQSADWMLDAGGPEDVPAADARVIAQRAQAAADAIRAATQAALASSAFIRGASDASTQAAAEQAAMGALRSQAQAHASGVLNAGRTTQAAADAGQIKGSRYTSILDGRRCAACALADDDVLRPLDDPVRLARVPPNPDCEGGGRCRCMEAFELLDEAPSDA